MILVASVTKIYGEAFFLRWLDKIPYHVPQVKREELIAKARVYQNVLWTEKGGFQFY